MLYTLLSSIFFAHCSLAYTISAEDMYNRSRNITLHLYYYLHTFISMNYEVENCKKE